MREKLKIKEAYARFIILYALFGDSGTFELLNDCCFLKLGSKVCSTKLTVILDRLMDDQQQRHYYTSSNICHDQDDGQQQQRELLRRYNI